MTLEDMTTASEVIYDVVDPEANIIVGAVVDEALEGRDPCHRDRNRF